MIDIISTCDKSLREIDVEKYNHQQSRQVLKDTFAQLSKQIPNQTKLTLATKIMLGVFGNVPAFDRSFKAAMGKLTNAECGFTAFNDKSILKIHKFYLSNKQTIDALAASTSTSVFGYGKSLQSRHITRAKVIDIVGFQYGYAM